MSEPVTENSAPVEGVLARALREQGSIKPGEPGYWRLWGATLLDIRQGDLIMLKYSDDPPGVVHEFEVTKYDPRIADHSSYSEARSIASSTVRQLGNLYDLVRPRFLAADGEYYSIGAMQRFVLFRKGTHNTLSEYVH